MKFIDEAFLEVQAGRGGSGSTHFRREKFIPLGGPDGGNGGHGGSVVLKADNNVQTLLDFKFRPLWKGQAGHPGEGSLKDGKSGEDVVIPVPVGTQVFSESEGSLIADLDLHGERYLLAKGGRGGKGNTFFKSATNRSPRHHQPGESGDVGKYKLSLKLVADVGLIGFPNVGKSTFLSVISAARPKVADYPFTTLTPNLGVTRAKRGDFVVADIPGLIPGAHTGRGLGDRFLKHVERTKILAHLIDPWQTDHEGKPLTLLESYNLIRAELESFSAILAKKAEIVLITKGDTLSQQKQLDQQRAELGCESVVISAVSSMGVDAAIEEIASEVLISDR